MVETTEEYRNRINQLKTSIENEPYIQKMRDDIAEGISKTGNRQADIEIRQDTLEDDFVGVQQDASSASPSGAEVAVARAGFNTLDERLTTKEQEVTAQFAQTVEDELVNMQGVNLSEASLAEVTSTYTGVQPITSHDGWLYGFENNATIVKSNDEGNTWQAVATAPYGSVHSIYWTDDGEVIITNASQISKSIGWGSEPSTVTWTTKATKSNAAGVGILPWGIDGDGQKFIATEYSGTDRSHSRYVWISVDAGDSWNIVVDKYDIDPNNLSHMHGVCYDKWEDRFFLSHGHGDIMGVYYSDDDGVTWNKIGGEFQPNAAATTLTATDNGIVLGSDSNDAGLYGIARTNDPSKMEMKQTARWYIERSGVTGFAYRSVRDEKTGHVYVAFKPDNADVRAVIFAGTATTGSFLWRYDTPGAFKFTHLALTESKIYGLLSENDVQTRIELSKPTFGNTSLFDSPNLSRGWSRNSTSIAVGRNVEVNSENEIVIGENAGLEPTSSNQNNVVLGNSALGSSRSVSIGYGAKSGEGSSDSVAIGRDSNTGGISTVAIGHNANINKSQTGATAIGADAYAAIGGVALGYGAATGASTPNSVAIGSSSYAGTSSVGIGRLASAGTQQVAIGLSATANHLNSVALGANVTTTETNQLNIGARHLEMKKVTEPVNVPPDTGRLFVKDDGSGNMQLCIRLGAKTTILATSV